MSVDTLSLDNAKWLRFVEENQFSGPFHHPAWNATLRSAYGMKGFVAAVFDDEHIVAGIPLLIARSLSRGTRLISLPFTDSLLPLSTKAGAMEELYEWVSSRVKSAEYSSVQVRHTVPDGIPHYKDSSQVLHLLRLHGDEDSLLRTFDKRPTRQNISIGEKSGFTLEMGSSEKLLKIFYDLHLMTRVRHGVPIQPKKYFQMLYQNMLATNLGFIAVAFKEGVPAASALFLRYHRTLIYKYGASDERFRKLCPNHFLLWNVIRWASKESIESMDWGKSEKVHEGLRTFKRGWGTVESELVYSTFSPKEPKPQSYALFNAMNIVIRHSPKIVCRAAGKLLYRFAG